MKADDEKICEQLSAYLDGELPEAEAKRVEETVSQSEQLAEELARLRATRELLRDLPMEKAPEDLAGRVMAQVERSVLVGARPSAQPRRPTRWVRYAAAAAVILVAMGIGAVVKITMDAFRDGPPVAKTPEGPEAPVITQAPDADKEGDGKAGGAGVTVIRGPDKELNGLDNGEWRAAKNGGRPNAPDGWEVATKYGGSRSGEVPEGVSRAEVRLANEIAEIGNNYVVYAIDTPDNRKAVRDDVENLLLTNGLKPVSDYYVNEEKDQMQIVVLGGQQRNEDVAKQLPPVQDRQYALASENLRPTEKALAKSRTRELRRAGLAEDAESRLVAGDAGAVRPAGGLADAEPERLKEPAGKPESKPAPPDELGALAVATGAKPDADGAEEPEKADRDTREALEAEQGKFEAGYANAALGTEAEAKEDVARRALQKGGPETRPADQDELLAGRPVARTTPEISGPKKTAELKGVRADLQEALVADKPAEVTADRADEIERLKSQAAAQAATRPADLAKAKDVDEPAPAEAPGTAPAQRARGQVAERFNRQQLELARRVVAAQRAYLTKVDVDVEPLVITVNFISLERAAELMARLERTSKASQAEAEIKAAPREPPVMNRTTGN